MVKLGILGGTFDPIHRGHLNMAEAVYTQLQLNHCLLVPAGDPPHKQTQSITPAHHRVQMLALALKDYPHFDISTIDIDRLGPHYSTDMVRLLRKKYEVAVDDCFFVVGADSLIDLPTWHQPQQLLTLCRLAVVRRPGYIVDMAALTAKLPTLPQRMLWIEATPLRISATDIRLNLQDEAEVESQVPAEVMAYITAHQLYTSN